MSQPEADATHCAVRLRTAITLLARRLRASAPQDGLGVAKLSALGQLYRGGPMTPSELAAREGVKLQSLTRLLADLESEHLVSRKPHPGDGRQTLLSLTKTGLGRLSLSVRGAEASLAHVIEATLSAKEQALLLQACGLLDTLAQALADDEEGAAAGSG